MREEILAFEKASQSLDPSPDERAGLRGQIISHTEDFIDHIEDRKAFFSDSGGDSIKSAKPGKETDTIEGIISKLREELDSDGINPASGGHLGYIPGGGIYASSLADYWAAITNRYAGVFFANPGAVRIENKLIRWLNDEVGYPDGAHGNLTSGGSIANLVGIVTARSAMNIKAVDIPKSSIYMTQQGHHSLDKAIKVAALHECHIRFVEMDEQYRMSIPSLKRLIQQDKEAGIRPFLLLGSAGTTDLGAIDPMDQMADVAAENNMWFHVDAAYGGFFMLTEQIGDRFRGMERSDSICIDPHKGMFLPYGIGVCLVRNGELMKKAFAFKASYLQDIEGANEEINPMDVSPEMTKHFRGLRMWLPLMLYGIEPFKACLEEKLLLAKYFHSEISKIPGFEAGPEPQLSVVTFRFLPEEGEPDQVNKKILEELHKDGRVFFSSTTIDGNFTLRLAILSFRTHLRTIDLLIEILQQIVQRLHLQPRPVARSN